MQAKLDAHQNALTDSRLIAPFDGYIQEKFFDAHETVSAGLPIVSMINTSWYEVEIDIPATDFVRKDQFKAFRCQTDVYPGQRSPWSYWRSHINQTSTSCIKCA